MLFNRRMLLLGATSSLAILTGPVKAGLHLHGTYISTGRTQLGGFSTSRVVSGNTVGGCYPFMNFIKAWESLAPGANSPTVLDSNGYPSGSLSANIGGIIAIPQNYSGSWVFKWTGTLSIDLQFGILVSAGGGFVTGGGAGGNTNTTIAGTNGRVVFTITQSPFPATVNLFFIAGGTFSGLSNIVLCRSGDEASVDAGGILNPDFLGVLRQLNPKILRQMGWTTQSGSEAGLNAAQYQYRQPDTAMSFVSKRYPPTIWAGTIGGTNTYTCGSYTDMPGTWTDKEMFQGTFTNASTSTIPTINVNSRGAKTIVLPSGLALGVGDIAAGSNATFMYDATLDKVLWVGDALYVGVPVSVQVALCNALGCDMWYNITVYANDNYVTQTVSYIRDNLSAGLNLYLELSNEIWNFSFTQTNYAINLGAALGFPSATLGTIQQCYSWYGYRTRQIMALASTAWAVSRTKTSLKRVMAVQAFGNNTNFQTYRLNGNDLTTAGFNAFPNRPIDFCDVLSYAPYAAGAQLNVTYPADASGATDYANMTNAADLYATGTGPNIASALALVDADFRSTSTYPPGSNPGNLFSYSHTSGAGGNGVYYGWETVAASYDGARPSGYTNLTVECYEGCPQFLAPTTAQCTGLNISTTYSAKVATLILAYQNSALASQLVIDYCKQFLGTDPAAPTFGLLPHSKTMAFLELEGPDTWSLLPGDIYSTPFQTFNGVAAFNH